MNIPDGFMFLVLAIIVMILVSIQFTLNMILRELKAIRLGRGIPEPGSRKDRGGDL